MLKRSLVAVILVGAAAAPTAADVIGQIKKVEGAVTLVRDGESKPAMVGGALHSSDAIETGADGSIGITFIDKTMFAAGPATRIALDKFRFNPSTMKGRLRATLDRGTLKVVSGEMTKGDPEAVKVRTPRAILGVRGTELLIQSGVDARVERSPATSWDDYHPGDGAPHRAVAVTEP